MGLSEKKITHWGDVIKIERAEYDRAMNTSEFKDLMEQNILFMGWVRGWYQEGKVDFHKKGFFYGKILHTNILLLFASNALRSKGYNKR